MCGEGEGCVVVLCVVLVFYVLEMPLVLSHSQGFLDNKGCTCILCFLIACKNYVSAVCAFNSLVYAALKRANKPETVSIVLILTVCSSYLCMCASVHTYVSNMYNLFTSVHIIVFASYVRKYIGW